MRCIIAWWRQGSETPGLDLAKMIDLVAKLALSAAVLPFEVLTLREFLSWASALPNSDASR